MAKTVADIIAEYNENMLLHKHVFEQKCAANEDLQELEAKMRAARFNELEAVLQGGSASGELAELEAKTEHIISTQIDFPRYMCNICKDSGHTEAGVCRCLKNLIYEKCYGAVKIENLPQNFNDFDLNLFDNKKQLPVGKTQRELMLLNKKHAHQYIVDFPNNKYKNVFMAGKAGLGKTYLLSCMAVEAKNRDIDVLFMRAVDLHDLFFAKRMDESVDLSYLQNAALLMIDDLGVEPITQNVSTEGLYALLSKRMEQAKHTVIATNVDDLQKRYDDRIASRLLSKMDSLRFYFDGRDLRRY